MYSEHNSRSSLYKVHLDSVTCRLNKLMKQFLNCYVLSYLSVTNSIYTIELGKKKWLVSLFNGISTFVGYLMPRPFSKNNSSDTI